MSDDEMAKVWRRMKVPKRYWDVTWDAIPKKCTYRRDLQAYCLEMGDRLAQGMGFLLWGNHSTGKTALTCLLLREAFKCRCTGLFVSFDVLGDFYVDNMQFDDEQSYVERLHSVDLLVIDEVICAKSRLFHIGRVEQIIRARTMDNCSTVLTTNMSLNNLKEVARGLYEVCRETTYPLKIQGHDFRAKGVKNMKSILDELKKELP